MHVTNIVLHKFTTTDSAVVLCLSYILQKTFLRTEEVLVLAGNQHYLTTEVLTFMLR